jgi:hypothetical protein
MSEAFCTKDNPYSDERDKKEKPTKWVHADAKIVYECDEYEKFECPYCGTTFKQILPSH